VPATKVVILAGGRGTRLSEETHSTPKPMVPIGGRPVIWHIMSHYARHGFRDFVIACGYKGYVLKEYFKNYLLHESDVRVDLRSGEAEVLSAAGVDWTVTLVDTGVDTMTGGRLRRLAPLLEERFLLTYGDGVSNVPVGDVIELHDRLGATATITAVSPPPRFGLLEIDGERVTAFREKPADTHDRINGGYFVMEPAVIDLLEGDDCTLEAEPLATLARRGELAAYHHDGFWMPMDPLRDRDQLDALARLPQPPWTIR
jgi:glucose-1-phosphate cytidylyltransferase